MIQTNIARNKTQVDQLDSYCVKILFFMTHERKKHEQVKYKYNSRGGNMDVGRIHTCWLLISWQIREMTVFQE
jgi:hypothetical protein